MSTVQEESLRRAKNSNSMSNYEAIYAGFEAKGIAEDAIDPRENVFTYNAWRALGRTVKRGEHGVKITTWIPMELKDKRGNSEKKLVPRNTTVFHISQTEKMWTNTGGEIPPIFLKKFLTFWKFLLWFFYKIKERRNERWIGKQK